MHLRFAFLPSFLCLTLLTMQAAGGDAPRAGAPVRIDRYGDPLPHGVVARLGTERLTLGGSVSVLKFSPDGRRLAAYDISEQLRVWEVSSGKELLRIKALPFRGSGGLAFSPDGKALAMGCGDRTIRVWDAATGKELHRFGSPMRQVMHLNFSRDGRFLFAGSHDSPVLCWDLASGGKPRTIGESLSSRFMALSRDGKTVTTGSYDTRDGRKWTFARWDTASGKELGRHALTLSGKWTGELSPEGGILARPEEDGKSITLLDPLTGRELSRAQGSDYPANMAFSADGSLMTCRSKDGHVRVWDTATGKVRARFKALSTSIDRIALSPDGKRLALSGRADDAVHVWDVAVGRELHSFAGHRSGPLTIAFLKDGKEIATVSRDGSHAMPMNEWADWSLRRWEAATGAEPAVTSRNPKGEVYHTTFSADGRRLATVIHDGTLHLWDVESGKELRNWKVPTKDSTLIWRDNKGGQTVFKTPHPAITQPAFSPDGKTLLAAEGPKIYRWETATGRELPAFEVEGTSPPATWCLPSPDGRTLLVWTWGRHAQVVLLDAASGKVRRKLEGIRAWTHQPAFSPDGRTIAVDEAREVSLWEAASGQPRGRLTGPRMTFALAFSPGGRFLAIGTDGRLAGDSSPVSLWDLATGQIIGRLRDDFGRVQSLAFSPDGSRLAVAGYSPTVLVCDVAELCGKKKIEEIAKITIPSAEELEGLWAELSGADGARAYRAIRRLGLTGSRGAVFLKARLKGDKPPEERRIARLIADLDDDRFATREKASVELGKLGRRAEPALRRTLEGQVSAEVRLRVKLLLERLDAPQGPSPSPELVRLRAVEALEANSTKEARQALAELSQEAADAQLRQEAKASLARLRSRRVQP